MHQKNIVTHVRCHFLFTVLIIPMLVVLASTGARGATQSIVGDPLEIYCYDTGQMAVKFEGVHQFHGDDVAAPGNEWGSVLMFDDGGNTRKYADPYHDAEAGDSQTSVFTAESNESPSASGITTRMLAGDSGITVVQRILYTDGDNYFQMVWDIRNTSNRTYTNVKFFHGGHASFAGSDQSRSFWDHELDMIYLRNSGVSGLMEFYGDVVSRADRHYGGAYLPGVQQAIDGSLGNTADSDYEDAGYHLQWNLATLYPGHLWEVTAYGKWTAASDVQVLALSNEYSFEGYTEEISFVVRNFGPAEDTFDLEIVDTEGWQVAANHDSVTLAAEASAVVTVLVDVPGNSDGEQDIITLSAVSRTDAGIHSSDSVTVTSRDLVSFEDDDDLCFIATGQNPPSTAAIALLCAGIFLGLLLNTRRKNGIS